jgi:hypothetical protein
VVGIGPVIDNDHGIDLLSDEARPLRELGIRVICNDNRAGFGSDRAFIVHLFLDTVTKTAERLAKTE